jgi:hypothetical protein
MEISNVHLVIVTGLAQCNLIPILQLKPKVVALAVSSEMKRNGNDFVKLLNRAADYLHENIIRFDDVPASNLLEIEHKALEIYQNLHDKYPDEKITYHATGGTGIMVLGFCKVFSEKKQIVIYTDTAHGQIEIVQPRGEAAIAIEPVLKMGTYLRSLGFQFQSSTDNTPAWVTQAQSRRPLTEWLAEHSEALNNFFGDMNYFATQAMNAQKNSVIAATQTLNHTPRGIYRQALEMLVEYKICDWEHLQITFNSLEGAKYLSGFWLEEFTWLTAQDLGISEVKANVKFHPLANNKVKNEMDCIAEHNNRLLMMECKTATLAKDGNATNNMLYKLEALGSAIGGLYHEKWLVSARPVPLETELRAQERRIKIISPDQLNLKNEVNLKTELEKWRDAKR